MNKGTRMKIAALTASLSYIVDQWSSGSDGHDEKDVGCVGE